MEETEAGHRPGGEGRFHGLCRAITVEHVRIAQEMDVDESKEDEQTEAAAYSFSQMAGHSKRILLAFQERLVNSIGHVEFPKNFMGKRASVDRNREYERKSSR